MWWWLGVAVAGELRFDVSAGTRVEVMPSVVPGRVDFVLHDNTIPLHAQVRRARGHGVRWLRARDLGGEQVVHVRLAEGFASLDARVVEGTLSISGNGEAPSEQVSVGQAPALDVLLEGGGDGTPCAPRALPLLPLVGDERRWLSGPGDLGAVLPRWEEAEPARAAWSEVTLQREILLNLRGGDTASHGGDARPARARALYALGALHRDLGHTREAAYYFGAANEEHGGDGGLAALQRAGALAVLGRGPEALSAASTARRLGAPDEGVATVVAGAALLGAAPMAPAARALVVHSSLPGDLLRAGDLLLRDRCDVEATSVLRAALDHLPPPDSGYARLLLADALALSGDPGAATVPLSEIAAGDVPAGRRRLPRVRGTWLAMLQRSPDAWLAEVPTLERLAREPDVAGGDALVLLAQVHAALGQPAESLRAYSRLADELPGAVPPSVVVGLARTWEARTRELFAADRGFDAALLFSSSWRPWMRSAISEPQLLARVAAAQAGASLPGTAVETLGTLAAVQGERGLDDGVTILAIAELYADSGRTLEASEALATLSQRELAPAERARAAFVRSRVAAAEGDEARALRELAVAAGDPAVAPRATRARALLDARAGRCASAREVLAAAAAEGNDPEARDAWIACGVGGSADVPRIDGDTDDDAFARYRVARVSGDAAAWVGAAQGDSTWAQLARGDAEAAASGR
jgi:tetratricopeptide (TPR) repeat protein